MTHDELQNNSSDTGTKVPMTHDELLAKIDAEIVYCGCDGYVNCGDDNEPWDALRAVVELAHKDIQHESYVWLDGYDFAMKEIIKAIEKELG